jgi:peptide/nickel transport system substrate-binding protein
MRLAAVRLAALASTAALLAAVSGCGGGGDGEGTGSGLPAAGGGGTLAYAIPSLPATLDPLAATGRPQQTMTRQIYEPLIESLSGPYGETQLHPGLALTAKPSPDRTVWALTLRPDVRFQDGTPFNAAAVLANSRRWSSLPAGRSLLPHLFAVDAPRPDEVRFLLDSPVRDLPRRLASPRLGIVSPTALVPQGGNRARFRSGQPSSGTGPFQAGPGEPGRLQLSRYPAWWGSPLGLGPALDSVAFLLAPSPGQRLQLLQNGSAQVADPLDRAGVQAAAADPLLDTVGGPGTGIGMDGSVRGIDSARAVPLLSRVWLTNLTG